MLIKYEYGQYQYSTHSQRNPEHIYIERADSSQTSAWVREYDSHYHSTYAKNWESVVVDFCQYS